MLSGHRYNKSSLVSLITPSFNRLHLIHETANSIFQQTYPSWEWIVIDDGSTDGSLELLQEYAQKDARVKIFQRKREPSGACTCRNIGVENCSGEFLIFLDSDDILLDFCLQQRVSTFLNNPNYDFLVFPLILFHEKVDDLNILWNIETADHDIDRLLIADSLWPGTGTIWRKSSFVRIGMWREDLFVWQDVELHLRSLTNGIRYKKFLSLNPDIYIRTSPDSISRSNYNSKEKIKSRFQIYFGVLEENDINFMVNHRSGIRDLFVSVFNSAICHAESVIAIKSILAARKKDIISQKESLTLYFFIILYFLRLNHTLIVRRGLELYLNNFRFTGERFLCKVKFKNNQ